jgi:O-antigen/teichoic acid export membrane protein
MPNTSTQNKRIAKNTFLLYIRMGFTMVISLYTSRVVLNTLGVEDFGIYNLVGGVIILFSFLSSALNGSIQRFLTFELGRNNLKQFNKVFNVSLLSLSFISFFLLILFETVGIWFINEKLVIDETRLLAANVVFQVSLVSFLLNINTTPYNSAIIAFEKMSIYAYVGVFEVVMKLLIVFLLPVLPYDKLMSYGVLILVVTFISRGINIAYCKYKFSSTRFNFIWDKVLFKQLLSFSGWTILGSIGNILSRQGINIIFNLFFGVVLNAAFAISTQVSNAVFMFVGNFQTAFSPQITKLYASNSKEELYLLVDRAARLSFYLLLVVVLPITLNVDAILTVWLKIVPDYTNYFVLITLGVMLIDTISGPLWMVINSTGEIKSYQIYISLLTFVNVGIIYVLLFFGFSPVSALLTRLIFAIVLLLTRLWILQQKIDFNVLHFFKNTIQPILYVSICAVIAWAALNLFDIPNGIFSIILKSTMAMLLSLPIIYFIGLSLQERQYITNFIHKKLLQK